MSSSFQRMVIDHVRRSLGRSSSSCPSASSSDSDADGASASPSTGSECVSVGDGGGISGTGSGLTSERGSAASGFGSMNVWGGGVDDGDG